MATADGSTDLYFNILAYEVLYDECIRRKRSPLMNRSVCDGQQVNNAECPNNRRRKLQFDTGKNMKCDVKLLPSDHCHKSRDRQSGDLAYFEVFGKVVI